MSGRCDDGLRYYLEGGRIQALLLMRKQYVSTGGFVNSKDSSIRLAIIQGTFPEMVLGNISVSVRMLIKRSVKVARACKIDSENCVFLHNEFMAVFQ